MVSLNGPPSPLHRIDGAESVEVVFAPYGAHGTESPAVFQPRLSHPMHAFIPSDGAFGKPANDAVVQRSPTGIGREINDQRRNFDSADTLNTRCQSSGRRPKCSDGQRPRGEGAAMPEHGTPGLVHREVAAL